MEFRKRLASENEREQEMKNRSAWFSYQRKLFGKGTTVRNVGDVRGPPAIPDNFQHCHPNLLYIVFKHTKKKLREARWEEWCSSSWSCCVRLWRGEFLNFWIFLWRMIWNLIITRLVLKTLLYLPLFSLKILFKFKEIWKLYVLLNVL